MSSLFVCLAFASCLAFARVTRFRCILTGLKTPLPPSLMGGGAPGSSRVQGMAFLWRRRKPNPPWYRVSKQTVISGHNQLVKAIKARNDGDRLRNRVGITKAVLVWRVSSHRVAVQRLTHAIHFYYS